jgi:predicted nucleic acid-binding protein
LTTDAHLAALSVEYGAMVATYDADFSRFPGVSTVDPDNDL